MTLADSPQDVQELSESWPLAYQFDLPPQSSILVAGAYKGKVVQLLADLYPDYRDIYGFEPQLWALDEARNRLVRGERRYRNTHLFGYGLGTASIDVAEMGEWFTDACSFVNVGPGSREHGFAPIREFNEVMFDLGVEELDLAVINMEGYEFLLLPHLLATGWSERIHRLAVQWHIDLGVGGEAAVEEQIRGWEEAGHTLVVDDRPAWTYSTLLL